MELEVREQKQLLEAYHLTDHYISKAYLDELINVEVNECTYNEEGVLANIRLLRLNKIAYDKQENIINKLVNVYNAIYDAVGGLALIIDGKEDGVDFYLGVRTQNDNSVVLLQKTLSKSIQGNFPGCEAENLNRDQIKEVLDHMTSSRLRHTQKVISSVSGAATLKNEDEEVFVQGIEKFIDAMRGEKYTAIFLADAISKQELRQIRSGYESIYSQLSPFAQTQLSFGENESASITEGISLGFTNSTSKNLTQTQSFTKGSSESQSSSESKAHTKNPGSIASSLGTTAGGVVGSFFGPAGAIIGGAIGNTVGTIVAANVGSNTTTHSSSSTYTTNESITHGSSETVGTTHSESEQKTYSKGDTTGHSRNLQITLENKTTKELLARIDEMLERVKDGENLGMWNSAAYFIAEDVQTAGVASSTYAAIMRGEKTATEGMHINVWDQDNKYNLEKVTQSLKCLQHPVLNIYPNTQFELPCVTPATFVTTKELAIQMSWPRKSVNGVTVVEYAEFSRDVITYERNEADEKIALGNIYHMGKEDKTKVLLDLESLSMHTFITGATGSGKSNTVYYLINELKQWHQIPFMVIEPAKGEYKHVFGKCKDVEVLGTNPKLARMLKINPFKFPAGIHVLEHVDRLVEIFNVCWPMYAAMPAVLKEAILKAYEGCGWDLDVSENAYAEELFPTFIDLEAELVNVINESAYAEEVKSNYIGSLATRIKSLTNGLNGQIFSADEMDNKQLFDKSVIVDLSRVGSSETKALIMGVLVMRLNEHRMAYQTEMNSPLKHITVLEEAHHILKRTCTQENAESPSVAGKSVEMLANAIAEMRTYGEGFIIADQSPSAVDTSAIRNTNTKIIMRLPDEIDRRLAGKAAALKEEQLAEIAKLPRGTAVIYQNNWLQPVLCKIYKYEEAEGKYEYQPNKQEKMIPCTAEFRKDMLTLLMKARVDEPVRIDVEQLVLKLEKAQMPVRDKLVLYRLIDEYRSQGRLELWREDRFSELARVTAHLLNAKMSTRKAIEDAQNFDELTQLIYEEIDRKTEGSSNEIKLAATQCLLKYETEKSVDRQNVYVAWVTEMKKKTIC